VPISPSLVVGSRLMEGSRLDYKRAISDLVEDPAWRGVFRRPDLGVMEHPLALSNRSGRADFCYELGGGGRLFIEDEDAPRALNNLLKYWRWCADNPGLNPVHLIHVIGTADSVFVDHCRFLQPRIQEDLKTNGFRYHIVTLDCHWTEAERWLPEVRDILDEIRVSLSHDPRM